MWYFPDFWGAIFSSVFVRVEKPDKICTSFIFYSLKCVEHRLSVTLWTFWAYLECLCVLNLKCEVIKSSSIIKFNTFSQKNVCWFILVSFVTLHCHCAIYCAWYKYSAWALIYIPKTFALVIRGRATHILMFVYSLDIYNHTDFELLDRETETSH